jgi:hypothetical protein
LSDVDLVASAGTRAILVIEKGRRMRSGPISIPRSWSMATAATPLLAGAPDLDLYEAISAHDLE